MYTHTLTRKITTPGRSVNAENTFSGDGQSSRTISVPDSTSDKLVNLAMDVSQIQCIYMKSDQDLTVETNDGAAPDDTINLLADKPYVWHAGSYFANLLTVDVTKLYLTNNSGAEAMFELEVVVDSTP